MEIKMTGRGGRGVERVRKRGSSLAVSLSVRARGRAE